ncbi:uncharacterized protein LAESUDRAFT_556763 [Laetiporus sulphureus 93-53]|uniref:RRM domain-containing protein n=1 Tax=Laetiporus sulphureus 93-53 TaxID=1314785 RepID=A0A165B726_9APHY|nr:uncharacterized protein LAESUDRAFT_556763 [Laetiporus sulphureus 93-53]KZT00395.1 hypothetical protein LAESUDRAFT_556763 [Laetiporus sulphureus 93-53]
MLTTIRARTRAAIAIKSQLYLHTGSVTQRPSRPVTLLHCYQNTTALLATRASLSFNGRCAHSTREVPDQDGEPSSKNADAVSSQDRSTVPSSDVSKAFEEDDDASFGVMGTDTSSSMEELPESPRLSSDPSQKPPTSTLFVGLLPPFVKEQEISNLFEAYGDVKVRMRTTSTGQNYGFAHVDFPSRQHATMAMAEHQEAPFSIRGRSLNFEFSRATITDKQPEPNRTIYVANVPFNSNEEDIGNVFESFGEIERVRMEYDDQGWSRGVAHIAFRHPADAQAVTERQMTKGFELEGRRLFVQYARNSSDGVKRLRVSRPEDDDREGQGIREPMLPSEVLRVSNLPARRGVTEQDIRELFAPFDAKVKAVRFAIFADRPRTYAHVEFATKLQTERIMNAHQQSPLKLWNVVDLILDYATPVVHSLYDPYHKLYTPAVTGDAMDVKALFGRFADNIVDVQFHPKPYVDPSIRSAFIEFDTIANATAAKNEFDGKEIRPGLRFALEYARPRMRMSRKGPRTGPPIGSEKRLALAEEKVTKAMQKRRNLETTQMRAFAKRAMSKSNRPDLKDY